MIKTAPGAPALPPPITWPKRKRTVEPADRLKRAPAGNSQRSTVTEAPLQPPEHAAQARHRVEPIGCACAPDAHKMSTIAVVTAAKVVPSQQTEAAEALSAPGSCAQQAPGTDAINAESVQRPGAARIASASAVRALAVAANTPTPADQLAECAQESRITEPARVAEHTQAERHTALPAAEDVSADADNAHAPKAGPSEGQSASDSEQSGAAAGRRSRAAAAVARFGIEAALKPQRKRSNQAKPPESLPEAQPKKKVKAALKEDVERPEKSEAAVAASNEAKQNGIKCNFCLRVRPTNCYYKNKASVRLLPVVACLRLPHLPQLVGKSAGISWLPEALFNSAHA